MGTTSSWSLTSPTLTRHLQDNTRPRGRKNRSPLGAGGVSVLSVKRTSSRFPILHTAATVLLED